MGCAHYRAQPIAAVVVDRALTPTRDGIRVTVAVPSDERSERLFGASTFGKYPVSLEQIQLLDREKPSLP